jgi:hypothetical protein
MALSANFQLMIIAAGCTLAYFYTKKPAKVVEQKDEEGRIPRSQWPLRTDRVADYQWDALDFFQTCMTSRRGETDFLGKIEREQYFRECLQNNPDITWRELTSSAERATKPVG